MTWVCCQTAACAPKPPSPIHFGTNPTKINKKLGGGERRSYNLRFRRRARPPPGDRYRAGPGHIEAIAQLRTPARNERGLPECAAAVDLVQLLAARPGEAHDGAHTGSALHEPRRSRVHDAGVSWPQARHAKTRIAIERAVVNMLLAFGKNYIVAQPVAAKSVCR
jgi:hypothetical protein